MLRVNNLKINGIGGIDDLSLKFNNSFNIICGPNGVGKTTILECIAHSFSLNHSNFIRRKADHEKGKWSINLISEDNSTGFEFERRNFHPDERSTSSRGATMFASKVIVYKTMRNFQYIGLQQISKDTPKNRLEDIVEQGVDFHDSKNWFINRYMFSAHPDALSEIQLRNLETAKKLFGALDQNISYYKVKIETFDILLKSKDGTEIYFEYLSSGFKSVVYILLSLIKEIEYRFQNPAILVEDYDGIIIIDELDLHLHPQWQAKLINLLKEILPNAQVITSTHSPHMLQAADPNEIIPLGYSEEGSVILRDIPTGPYGYQGWTIEEILTDIMGLETTYSHAYTEAIKKFEYAIENDDVEAAKETFKILDQMLHPHNHLRKLLKLQLSTVGGGVYD